MSTFTSRQWITVVVGLALFISFFYINRKIPIETSVTVSSHAPAGVENNFQDILKNSESSLKQPENELIKGLVSRLSNSPDSTRIKLLHRLSSIYDSLKQPLAATYYMEELAKASNSNLIWYKTGQRYMEIVNITEPSVKNVLLNRASDCFNSILKNDSNNLEAKVGVGACIVEEGSNPMLGIKMITEVVNKDSNNESAQLTLGRFSLQSGQYAKAIYRFSRVMQINNSFKEGYVYIARAYEELGNNKEAIVNLKKYRNFAPNSTIKSEIDKHISELSIGVTN